MRQYGSAGLQAARWFWLIRRFQRCYIVRARAERRIPADLGDQRGVATLAGARVSCLRSLVQNENPRFAAVPSSVAGPARLVAQFRICLANSERDAGVIGLPVFIAVINSAELLGMVSATGILTRFGNSSKIHFSFGAEAVDNHIYFARRKVVLQ